MSRRTGKAVVSALALSTVLAGCGSDAGDAADDGTFTLVATLSMSGALSTFGAQGKAAFEAGIDILNEHGGIDGRKVRLKVIDTGTDPAKAVANVQSYLADNPKPDAMFAAESSGVALALAPILTQYEILHVTTANTSTLSDAGEFPYTFQQSIPPRTVNEELAAHLADEGHHTVAYVGSDDEFGHSAVEAFESEAQGKGLSVVPGFVPEGAVDASAALERVRAKRPDVLVLSGTGPVVTAMLKSRADIGWNIPTFGEGSAFATQNLGRISDPSQWNALEVQVPNWSVAGSPMLDTPAFEKFFEAFKSKADVQVAMAFPVAVYETLLTVKAAYEGTDEDDVASLAEVLEATGPAEVPPSIVDLWVGPSGLGYDDASHANNSWGSGDFSFVPGQESVDGMVS